MPTPTTAYTKNIIRRSLQEIVDPSPNRNGVDRIWQYFKSKCAYCGRAIDRSKKQGHIDHLVPASRGGANHAANRVLSCATCNEKEKLNKDWLTFMAEKVSNEELSRKRINRIKQWQSQNGQGKSALPADILEQLKSASNQAIDCYMACAEKIRHGK